MSVAPDYVEPVVAWRLWQAVDDHGTTCLASVFHPHRWPHGEPLVASCERLRIRCWPWRRQLHEAPAAGCTCGIYAASAAIVRQYLPDHLTRIGGLPILGRASLWGVVCECERGWRASHAYPERLYVPVARMDYRRAARVIADLRRYGVPVAALHSETADAVIEEVRALAAAA